MCFRGGGEVEVESEEGCVMEIGEMAWWRFERGGRGWGERGCCMKV